MKMKLRWLAIIIILIALTGLMGGSVSAQTTGVGQFFPETGHWVSGAFLEKYNSVPNGQELFGIPITDVFVDDRSELNVQYFENARFELHPESPPDLRVQLTPLGEFLYTPGEEIPIPPNFPSCRIFPETGFSVCYAFRDFFEANGDIAQFGYPISGFEVHEGWISQYFQRARFEWHPERPAGEQVVLSNLGTRYFQFSRENPALLQPNLDSNIPQQSISDLQVHAFVSKPVLPLLGNRQELYVIVYDQNFNPIENALIAYMIKLPNSDTIEDIMEPTDQRGLSSKNIGVRATSLGTVEIIITVTFRTLQEQTRTSFQIW